MQTFKALLKEVRNCQICAQALPHAPRPVVQIDPAAKILIAGQAPGRKVHASGIPFDDASGVRLREWMGISREQFYDPSQVAILPMGFCYPGAGKSGDLEPRRECAPAWREALLAQLGQLQLTLVIGQYAQRYHLTQNNLNVSETVAAWRDCGPNILPLPHPSPRNNIWLSRNPWFAKELIPVLQQRVQAALSG